MLAGSTPQDGAAPVQDGGTQSGGMASPRLTAALLANLNRTIGPAGVSLDALHKVTSGLVSTFQRLAATMQGAFQGLQQAQQQQTQAVTGARPQTVASQTQTQPPALRGSQVIQPTSTPTVAPAVRVLPPPLPTQQTSQQAQSPFAGLAAAAQTFASAVLGMADSARHARRVIDTAGAPIAGAMQSVISTVAPGQQQQPATGQPQTTDVTPAAERAGGSQGGGITSAALGTAVGVMSAPVTALVGAVGLITETFSSLVGTVQKFSSTLSPVAGQMFDRSIRDLHATIGVALLPVFNGLTQGVKAVSSALLPAMERMQPIFARMGAVIGTVAETFANAAGSILESLTPLIDFAAGVVEALTPVVQTISAVFSGLVKAVAGMFGAEGMDSVTKSLKSAFQSLAQAVILTSAQLAVWVGKMTGSDFGNKFIAGIKQALGIADEGEEVERKDATGLAPTNATTSDFGSFLSAAAKDAMLASMDGGTEKKTEDWLAQLHEDLESIKDGELDFIDKLATKIGDAVVNGMKTVAANGAALMVEPAGNAGKSALLVNPITVAKALFGAGS